MVVEYFAGKKLRGLSGDTKPVNIDDGWEFYETDTEYYWKKISGTWSRTDKRKMEHYSHNVMELEENQNPTYGSLWEDDWGTTRYVELAHKMPFDGKITKYSTYVDSGSPNTLNFGTNSRLEKNGVDITGTDIRRNVSVYGLLEVTGDWEFVAGDVIRIKALCDVTNVGTALFHYITVIEFYNT